MDDCILKKIALPLSLIDNIDFRFRYLTGYVEDFMVGKDILSSYHYNNDLQGFLNVYSDKLTSYFDTSDKCFEYKSNAFVKVINYEDSFKSIIKNDLIGELEDDRIEDFILSLMISYKSLLILSISGHINDITKDDILKLKDLSLDIIVTALSMLNKKDINLPENIMLEYENKANELMCDLMKKHHVFLNI